MNHTLKSLFLENPDLTEEIEAFCEQDPQYRQAREQFYEAAHEAAGLVGFDLYDLLERRLGAYMGRCADLYYLFGLSLRQEVLSALQSEVS